MNKLIFLSFIFSLACQVWAQEVGFPSPPSDLTSPSEVPVVSPTVGLTVKSGDVSESKINRPQYSTEEYDLVGTPGPLSEICLRGSNVRGVEVGGKAEVIRSYGGKDYILEAEDGQDNPVCQFILEPVRSKSWRGGEKVYVVGDVVSLVPVEDSPGMYLPYVMENNYRERVSGERTYDEFELWQRGISLKGEKVTCRLVVIQKMRPGFYMAVYERGPGKYRPSVYFLQLPKDKEYGYENIKQNALVNVVAVVGDQISYENRAGFEKAAIELKVISLEGGGLTTDDLNFPDGDSGIGSN